MEALWWIIAGSLVVIGIAGTILPALPGIVLVFFGLALAAWIDNFQRVGGATIAILGVFTLLAYLIEFAATGLGAKKFGASYKAVAGAAIGTLAGMFFGIPGLIAGPFVGAVLGEYIARPDLYKAGRAGFGAWIGLLFWCRCETGVGVLDGGCFRDRADNLSGEPLRFFAGLCLLDTRSPVVLLTDIVTNSARVAAARKRLQKIRLLADYIRRLAPAEIEIGVSYLAGSLPQGRLGVGYTVVQEALETPASGLGLRCPRSTALIRILQATGKGSLSVRGAQFNSPFCKPRALSRIFLMGELRQGALEGIVVEAIAKAASVPASDIRRAAMLAADKAPVARSAIDRGR